MKKNKFSRRIVAVAAIAAMMAGIVWVSAKSVSRPDVAPQAASDTCNCYKATPAPPCNDSIKVIEWRDTSCVNAVTIYQDFPNNNSGAGEFLALGTVDEEERRILLRVNLIGIVDSICRNPNLGRVAQFDSVHLTLYPVHDIGQYPDTGFIFRLGTITAPWSMGTGGGSLNPATTLASGASASPGSATWANSASQFVAGTPRNWPLSVGYDSVEFICHRPMPENPPMKDTIRSWISAPSTNYGWMVALDPALVISKQDYALVFYSSTCSRPELRPKLTLYFTRGENRDDKPADCARIYFIPAPK
jgi:hypothetical protein